MTPVRAVFAKALRGDANIDAGASSAPVPV